MGKWYGILVLNGYMGWMTRGWTMILAGKNYDAHESLRLGTPNIQPLEVSIVSGGSRISVAGVYRNPSSTPTQDLGAFHFLSAVVGYVDESIILPILPPLWLTNILRHHGNILGVKYCSSYIKKGWFNALPKQLAGGSESVLDSWLGDNERTGGIIWKSQ